MTALVETTHAGEFILSEAPGNRSRDNVVVLSGQNLAAGAVVGKVKYGIGGIVSVLSGTSPGNGTMTVIFPGPEVEVGDYLVQCTAIAAHGGTFSVTTPSGKVLPPIVMAGGTGALTAYTSRHINFTLTDGSGDFALTALFTVTVSATAPVVIGGTGNGAMSALSLGPDAKPGNYLVKNRAVVAEGGDFEVISPSGESIGRFLMGTGSGAAASFTSRHINFTLTDATDFALVNYFTVVVWNALVKKVVAWAPGTYDGRHVAAGVLYDAVDASGADKAGVLYCRAAEVASDRLGWATTITAAQKDGAYADLARVGVIAR